MRVADRAGFAVYNQWPHDIAQHCIVFQSSETFSRGSIAESCLCDKVVTLPLICDKPSTYAVNWAYGREVTCWLWIMSWERCCGQYPWLVLNYFPELCWDARKVTISRSDGRLIAGIRTGYVMIMKQVYRLLPRCWRYLRSTGISRSVYW
jgi:hypothetical protein